MTVVFEGKISLISEVLKDKDSVAWAGLTMANLHQIAASKTGQCILTQLRHSPRQIHLKPYYSHVQKDFVNAYADPVSATNAYYPFRPVRRGDNGLVFAPREMGTGKGSDVTVRFTPWRFDANIQAATLLHELTHATEQCASVLFSNALDGFDTTAEFDAILVENIYRSETGLQLRKDHHGWIVPVSVHMVPELDTLKRLIASFRARMPKMTEALAEVNAAFNPLRKGAQGFVGA